MGNKKGRKMTTAVFKDWRWWLKIVLVVSLTTLGTILVYKRGQKHLVEVQLDMSPANPPTAGTNVVESPLVPPPPPAIPPSLTSATNAVAEDSATSTPIPPTVEKGAGGIQINVQGNGNTVSPSIIGNTWGANGKSQWPVGCKPDKVIEVKPSSDGKPQIVAIPPGEYWRFALPNPEQFGVKCTFYKVPLSQISKEADGVEVDVRGQDHQGHVIGYLNMGAVPLWIKFEFKRN